MEPLSKQIALRATQGDAAAIETVVEQLRPRVARLAAHYAVRCRLDRHDLAQEAWVGILAALPNADVNVGSLNEYLMQHARWRLLDGVRKALQHPTVPLERVEGSAFEVAPAGEHDTSAEFIQRLNPGQQAIVKCLLAGLTWREAGTALGCTSPNIAYHMRAIKSHYNAWIGELV